MNSGDNWRGIRDIVVDNNSMMFTINVRNKTREVV